MRLAERQGFEPWLKFPRTVYEHDEEGGTLIVPGHGRVCDEYELSEYRDMIAIIRDRTQAMIENGASLEQVKAARLTADFDDRYGANTGPWTTDMFVEAVYTSLKQSLGNAGAEVGSGSGSPAPKSIQLTPLAFVTRLTCRATPS